MTAAALATRTARGKRCVFDGASASSPIGVAFSRGNLRERPRDLTLDRRSPVAVLDESPFGFATSWSSC